MTIYTKYTDGLVPVKIWTNEVEETAQQQLKNMSQLSIIHPKGIAAMADCHFGLGATVGSIIPTIKAVVPSSVGVDLSCGVLAAPTNLTANDLPDDLLKIRHSLERAIPVGFNAYAQGADHLTSYEAQALEMYFLDYYEEKYGLTQGRQGAAQQCGTLGGGNHFIELCLDEKDQVWILLHSGSRGIGNKIGTLFIELAKQDMERHQINLPDKDLAYLSEGSKLFDDYISAVSWAGNYASLNRRVMLRRIVEDLTHTFENLKVDYENRVISCHHNYISREIHYGVESIVTRKGALSAKKGELGVILGSMGARSYVVEGLGNEESYHSCSHGAGRRMSRGKAKKVISIADHEAATKGIECRKDKDVLDESPAAYKPIDLVMSQQTDLVKPLHELHQVLCIKG